MLRSELNFCRRQDWRTDQLCRDADRALAEAIEQLRGCGGIAESVRQRAVGRLRSVRQMLDSGPQQE